MDSFYLISNKEIRAYFGFPDSIISSQLAIDATNDIYSSSKVSKALTQTYSKVGIHALNRYFRHTPFMEDQLDFAYDCIEMFLKTHDKTRAVVLGSLSTKYGRPIPEKLFLHHLHLMANHFIHRRFTKMLKATKPVSTDKESLFNEDHIGNIESPYATPEQMIIIKESVLDAFKEDKIIKKKIAGGNKTIGSLIDEVKARCANENLVPTFFMQHMDEERVILEYQLFQKIKEDENKSSFYTLQRFDTEEIEEAVIIRRYEVEFESSL